MVAHPVKAKHQKGSLECVEGVSLLRIPTTLTIVINFYLHFFHICFTTWKKEE